MVLSHLRPSIFIPTLMVLWGAVSTLTALVKTPTQLIGMRFLLGVTEAGFSPAVIFMISTWYLRYEQSKRFMCYLSAGILSGAFGGTIAGAIVERLDGAHGVAGWKWYVVPFNDLSSVAEILQAVHCPRRCNGCLRHPGSVHPAGLPLERSPAERYRKGACYGASA